MKVTIEDAGACRKVMGIEVGPDAVAEEYDAILNAFTSQAHIDGFRPGKAPKKVVERRFRKQICQEAQDRLLPRFYHEALQKESLAPVSVIGVHDVSFAKEHGMSFKAMIDVEPEFKLPRYTKIPVKQAETTVRDEAVEESLERLREQYAEYREVTDRAAASGDFLQVDYQGVCDGQPLAEIVSDCSELAEGKAVWTRLDGERELLPGTSTSLLGMTPDEVREITVTFPEDYHVQAVAGKQAVYTVTLKALRERVLPEIDEKMCKQFDVENEAQLREKLRERLADSLANQERMRQENEMVTYLIEKTEFAVPLSLVEQQTRVVAREMIQSLAMQGMTQAQMEAQREELFKQAAERAERQVRVSYLLARIGAAEKIEVSEAEVEAKLNEMAERRNQSVEKIKADLVEHDGVEWLQEDLRAQKTMAYLLEHAKMKK